MHVSDYKETKCNGTFDFFFLHHCSETSRQYTRPQLLPIPMTITTDLNSSIKDVKITNIYIPDFVLML